MPGLKCRVRQLAILFSFSLGSAVGTYLPIPAHAGPYAPANLVARVDSLTAAALNDSAGKIIDEWLPAVRAADDAVLLASLLARRGRILAFYDRAKEAEPVLVEAVALTEALGDSSNLCMALRWLGVSVDSQGRRAEARQINRRLRDLARALHDRNNEGWAWFGLGWQAEEDGQIEEASRSYQIALDLFRPTGDARGEIWALNGLGSAAQRLGDLRRAGDFYEKSRRRAVDARHVNGELRAVNSLGSVEFARGDPAKALDAFRRVHELQLGLGNRREAIIPALNIAICRTHLGQYREAEDGLLENLSTCAAEGWQDLESKLKNQLILVKSKQGAHGDAARLCRQCLSRGKELAIQTRVMVSVALSGELARMDSCAAGLAVLEDTEEQLGAALRADLAIVLRGTRGLRLLELNRPAEALPLLRFVDTEAARMGLSKHRIQALAKAAEAYRKLGLPDSSLALLERACRVWEEERKIPANLDWRESRGITGQMVFADLAADLITRSSRSSEREGVAEAFDRLQVFKARTLLERLQGPRGREPDGGPEGVPPGLIGVEELQKNVLRPGEIFLDCYVGPEKSLVFAVTRDVLAWAPMQPESLLTTRISAYREILTAGHADSDLPSDDGAGLGRTVAAMESTLFGGVGALLRGKERIFISPDGPLHLVPFGLAAGPDSASSEIPAPARWVRVPSATVLSVIRSGRAADSGTPSARVLALAGTSTADGPSLEGARAEVRHLASHFRCVDVRFVPGKDEGARWRPLQDYDVIHIASHARTLERSPWQSEIDLHDADGGPLLAREVAGLHLRAALVVLSSCGSAGGRILSGEGVAGLTSAFLVAGVPAVVATLWPVDDRVTARFMEGFYRAMAHGEPVGSALRRAQAEIRGDPATRAPVYWAGFVLVGNDEIAVTLKSRWALPLPLTILFLILLGAVAAVLARRSRTLARL